eukprot:Gb_09695 [translate_table: standard]
MAIILDLLLFSIYWFGTLSLGVSGQQAYAGNRIFDCNDYSTESSGYVCNGAKKKCGTYTLFYAHPPFQTVSNISKLFNLDTSNVATASNVSTDAELVQDQPVLIPLTCDCIGKYSQINLKYKMSGGDTFFLLTKSLEGLTSCKALLNQNPSKNVKSLEVGEEILIPLRCACPTVEQIRNGVRYLLSYGARKGDTLHTIAEAFNTSSDDIIVANKLQGIDPTVITYANLLIPLKSKPTLHPSIQIQVAISPPHTISSSSVAHTSRRKNSKIGVYIGIAAGSVAVTFTLVAALLLVMRWRNRSLKRAVSVQYRKTTIPEDQSASTKHNSKEEFITSLTDMVMTSYTYEQLQEATENFSPECRIEGSVFHGMLNGTPLAIKQTKGEISKELKILHKVHHTNLIGLLGICIGDVDQSYLIFEYAENGSLSDWLHGGLAMKNKFISSCSCFLTWSQRLHICLDVARGLQYIHTYTEPSYVHKDIKSSNILLDAEFKAKIANFGMAKSSENTNKLPVFTRHISGTHGYLAPEYLAHGLVTPKIDVFAYGVLLLEILSGQPPLLKGSTKGTKVLLAETIGPLLEAESPVEELKSWIDPALHEAYSVDQALTLAKLAKSCVEQDSSLRPTTDDITTRVSRLLETSTEGEMLWNDNIANSQGR